MQHYVMRCFGEYPSAPIGSVPNIGYPWVTGRPLEIKVQTPLVYTLDGDRPGKLKAMYESCYYPLMCDDLIATLKSAGVDNLELFDAVIVDEETGKKYNNYKAFNIVGIIAATDFASSTVASMDKPMIDVFFESLAIDETKARGLRFFRLAESVTTMIADETVKTEVEKRNIPGMVFIEPKDWAG